MEILIYALATLNMKQKYSSIQFSALIHKSYLILKSYWSTTPFGYSSEPGPRSTRNWTSAQYQLFAWFDLGHVLKELQVTTYPALMQWEQPT